MPSSARPTSSRESMARSRAANEASAVMRIRMIDSRARGVYALPQRARSRMGSGDEVAGAVHEYPSKVRRYARRDREQDHCGPRERGSGVAPGIPLGKEERQGGE